MAVPADRKPLRQSLVLGAGYDLILGAYILILGRPTLEALGHPVPEPGFYFLLAALPLLLLPALYVSAARSEALDAFRPAVLWARGGGGAFILLLVLTLQPEASWLFLVIGVLDLGWALLHQFLWRH
jgi:hypothetical protein